MWIGKEGIILSSMAGSPFMNRLDNFIEFLWILGWRLRFKGIEGEFPIIFVMILSPC